MLNQKISSIFWLSVCLYITKLEIYFEKSKKSEKLTLQ